MIVKIPVSIGELIDKITILEIKNKKIKDKKKLINIKLELKLLNDFVKKKKLNSKDISESENLLILKKLNKIKDELKEIKKNL